MFLGDYYTHPSHTNEFAAMLNRKCVLAWLYCYDTVFSSRKREWGVGKDVAD